MIIKRDPDLIKGYCEDSSNLSGGFAEAVIIPETVGELSAAVVESNKTKTPMTVSGGGTATTGSRVPRGGVIISLERLDAIRAVSAEHHSCTAQAAVTVDALRDACDRAGLFYAAHPTERSATIGGTVATNASGARSFKYGPTRRYVKRLEMVMPTGEIVTLRRGEQTLRRGSASLRVAPGTAVDLPLPAYRMPAVKNAAGYFVRDGMDAIDLFIGQEGTLSIVTEVELGVLARPEKIFSAFVFFAAAEDAWRFAARARDLSREGARAPRPGGVDALSIEYFDVNALRFLAAKGASVPAGSGAAIFFEQETTSAREGAVVDAWLSLITSHGSSPERTWVAMTGDEVERFNAFRHAIPESVNEIVRRNGFSKLSADIAVPDGRLIEMMEHYAAAVSGSGMEHVVFGHIGENHLHANVLPRSDAEYARGREIILGCMRKGVSLGGTISAEHGVGKIKHQFLEVMYGPEGIREMARLKKALDPNWLLGLDTMFPRELGASL